MATPGARAGDAMNDVPNEPLRITAVPTMPDVGARPTGGRRNPVRGRLFRKYLVLILSLVGGALLVSGAISLYFSNEENEAALATLQREKAIAAAARIEQYIRQIEQQLAYASLPQLDASDLELRRIEFLKLLRQAPEVTDISQIDQKGCEQIYVSRLGMDIVGCGKDRSQEPAFVNARRGKPWYGPVYFRKETEPYMTIALRGSDSGPVTTGDLNLKFIWDVVSRIKVGDKGKAYVVDANGYLVADPDIGLVLRKTNLSQLPHVKRALETPEPAEPAMVSVDPAGTPVLTAVAPITTLGWKVFVEQPMSEISAKLKASFLRAGLVLLAGLVISALCALALARGMARPIRTLEEGAARIGAGDLDQRIDVSTGDELESLAQSFNQMSARLRESYAGLERKVEERTSELKIALEQQTAIGDILRAISNSPTDVQPVLDSVAEHAAHLCAAPFARVMLSDGERLNAVAEYWENRLVPLATQSVALDRTSLVGRAMVDRRTIHLDDVLPLVDTEFPSAKVNMLRFGCRAVLAVPLMREEIAYGGIFLARHVPGPFPPDQVALIETFARQAAIAIDNVRLFNETKEALERQTAISDILRAISASPTDVQPVLDAIVERAATLCEAAAASLYLTEGDKLRHLATKGASASPVPVVESIPIDRHTISGRALLERRAIQVEDVQAAADDYPSSGEIGKRLGHHTVIALPLEREGKPFGTLLLRRNEVRSFTEREIGLLRTFGDQAAIALENVRLFNETKEALEQQRASGEVLAAISSSIADTSPVFEKIVESCERLFAGKLVQLNLLGDDGLVHLNTYHGPGRELIAPIFPFPVDETSSTGLAIITRSVVHFPDVDGAPDVPPRARQGWTALGIKAAIAAPLLWEGKGMGAILVGRTQTAPFSAKEIALLRTFADQAVIAIQNARLFREIEEKGRQLEIANKHKSDFLANMSHELRTPLNAIIGFSEVLLEKLFGDVNEKQEDYLKDIHASGKHLLGLINDILDLSKIEAGRMELDRSTFDLPTTLANALTLVRERAQRHGIALSLDADPALGEISADERKLKQIVINLLTNAVKFTPDGGSVDVIARREPSRVVISVRDTGIGIAKADQAAVFEEFRQVGNDYTRKQEGTGLGLALTRRFVELHGGRIFVDSEPGKGSTFTFDIPIR